MQILTDYGHID